MHDILGEHSLDLSYSSENRSKQFIYGLIIGFLADFCEVSSCRCAAYLSDISRLEAKAC